MAVTTPSFSLLTSKVFDGESLTSLLEFKDTDGDSSFSITSSALSNGSCISKRLFSQTLLLLQRRRLIVIVFILIWYLPPCSIQAQLSMSFSFHQTLSRSLLKVW